MTKRNELKPLWQCPTCQTNFDKQSIAGLINALEVWLQGRPNPSLDPCIDKVTLINRLVGELKSIHRTHVRKPNNMMASQNVIGEDEDGA